MYEDGEALAHPPDMGMLSSAPNHNQVTEGTACGGSMAGDRATFNRRVRPRRVAPRGSDKAGCGGARDNRV